MNINTIILNKDESFIKYMIEMNNLHYLIAL